MGIIIIVINTANDPIIAPKDTYLKNAMNGKPMASIIMPAQGDMANTEPMPVALPFPPLNFKNIGQL